MSRTQRSSNVFLTSTTFKNWKKIRHPHVLCYKSYTNISMRLTRHALCDSIWKALDHLQKNPMSSLSRFTNPNNHNEAPIDATESQTISFVMWRTGHYIDAQSNETLQHIMHILQGSIVKKNESKRSRHSHARILYKINSVCKYKNVHFHWHNDLTPKKFEINFKTFRRDNDLRAFYRYRGNKFANKTKRGSNTFTAKVAHPCIRKESFRFLRQLGNDGHRFERTRKSIWSSNTNVLG